MEDGQEMCEEYIDAFIKQLDAVNVPQEDRYIRVWCRSCGSTLGTRIGEGYSQCCLDTIERIVEELKT